MNGAWQRGRVVILMVLTLAGSVGRAEGEGVDLVGLGDIEQGSLLIKTDAPGQYLPAPLVSTDVDLGVQGIVGRARVRQSFRNPTQRCVEAIYVFPLPDDSVVDRMQLMIGDRVIEGEVHEKAEARQVYETARREGRRASLLDEQRPNMFTVSVANLAEDEEIEIVIEYQQLVRYDAGRFHLRFPMVVGPRYNPSPVDRLIHTVSQTLGGSDGAAINPLHGPPSLELNPTRLVVRLDSGVALRSLESPSHDVQTTTLGPTSYEIRLVDGERSDRDFELVWEPDLGSQPSVALFTDDGVAARSADGSENHYSLLMVLPPELDSPAVRIPRETVFVIDTSGSMGGASIRQAKAALLHALDRLRPVDRFNVIEFNSYARGLFSQSRFADAENLDRSRQFVRDLDADGGTEMQSALELALNDSEGRHGEVRQVIFITDGMVGNESGLFAFIREHLGRTRLFPVGIGSAPNSHFMMGSARLGRGTFTYIARPQDVAKKMEELFRKLESPVLTDLRIGIDDPNAEIWPSRPADLYAGEPLVVALRTRRPIDRFRIDGQTGGRAWSAERVVPKRDVVSETGLSRIWAERKIESLLDGLMEGRSEPAVRGDVVRVALEHRLVSRYTSLVAVDQTPAGVDPAVCTQEFVPVNMPQGMTMGPGGALPQTATPAALLTLLGLLSMTLGLGVFIMANRQGSSTLMPGWWR